MVILLKHIKNANPTETVYYEEESILINIINGIAEYILHNRKIEIITNNRINTQHWLITNQNYWSTIIIDIENYKL